MAPNSYPVDPGVASQRQRPGSVLGSQAKRDLVVSFDSSGMLEMITLPSGDVMTLTHNTDGTFDYTWTSGGDA